MPEENSGNSSKTLPVICWILSLYFFIVFHISSGFPPIDLTKNSSWSLLVLSIFLFLLPFAKRIKLGKIFEFERGLTEIKSNIHDFKDETRQNLSMISSSINTISNLSNTVHVNVTSPNELEDAKQQVKEFPKSESTESEAKEIRKQLVLEDEDTIMALARTRILIEQALRKRLGKRLVSPGLENRDLTFLSARSLFQQFSSTSKAMVPLIKPFDSVMKVCNAAMHGQRVSTTEAEEALNLGAEFIALINEFKGEELQQNNG